MKRIEMFSTVCLDTSCYSTWNYFSQGSCHITHKVPVEQQHGSTELVQCTHKEDHFYPPSLARTTLAQGLPEESGFLVGWVFFFFLFWLLLWHCTSVSWGPRHSIQQFQQKELQGESLLRGCSGTALSILSLSTSFFTIFSHLFQGINHRIEILVLTISGMQRTNNSNSYRLCLGYYQEGVLRWG